ASVVVMLLADRGIAMSSDELAVFEKPPAELPYVNVHHFFVRIGVAVPELYVDASDTGLLILEKIGDLPLWDAVQGQSDEAVVTLFEGAIDQLLRIELRGRAHPDGRCIPFQRASATGCSAGGSGISSSTAWSTASRVRFRAASSRSCAATSAACRPSSTA